MGNGGKVLTIYGNRRVKFLKPGERYHWVRDTEWERAWEAEGLLPKRWAVAGGPVVISTYKALGSSISEKT